MIEAITSILPICDEFVVALGQSDEGDHTLEKLKEIDDPKIRIIESRWDIETFSRNSVYAQQTDIAKEACQGKWLFYIQCDEVVHEKYLAGIKKACQVFENDQQVEGFLFKYCHFWGDYDHLQKSHGWYQNEIRIIRNQDNIWSWRDAQSFRKYHQKPSSEEDYFNSTETKKLQVMELEAEVYHYGFVRPPHTMKMKVGRMAASYHGKDQEVDNDYVSFDYGPLNLTFPFKGTHPEVMKDLISRLDWKDQLQSKGKPKSHRVEHKHEQFKNRFLTLLEQKLFGGRHILSFRNYKRMGHYDG